jgi:hypothetical protein
MTGSKGLVEIPHDPMEPRRLINGGMKGSKGLMAIPHDLMEPRRLINGGMKGSKGLVEIPHDPMEPRTWRLRMVDQGNARWSLWCHAASITYHSFYCSKSQRTRPGKTFTS